MLQELASRLAIPGLPSWVGLVVLVVLLLVGLAYLLMPFSVFGVKGRLEAIEAQLDEIQTEIRSLALRLPDPGRGGGRRGPPVEDDWTEPYGGGRASSREEPPPPRVTPPIPPPAAWPDPRAEARQHRGPDPRTDRGSGGGRAEPRLDWPGSGGR
jgi:hypothetical protein